MNAIRRFLNWMTGWIVTGAMIVALGFGISHFSDGKESDTNATKRTKETSISKDEKLIEVRKEYWENGNLKSEVPYKKSYGLGWKKVKTKLKPHGIAKDYYESGTLKKEDPYVDGERTGTMKIYDEEGQLKASIEYKNSKQDGLETWYYSDGTVMDEVYYKDGNKTKVKDS
jgi:antitoxin component YwqK of YwqJK toxin-antitoxin module